MIVRTIIENLFLTINLAIIIGGIACIAWFITNTELTFGKGILLFMILLAIGSIRVSHKSPDNSSNTEVSGIVNKIEKLEQKK